MLSAVFFFTLSDHQAIDSFDIDTDETGAGKSEYDMRF